jgi:hypothetical protein
MSLPGSFLLYVVVPILGYLALSVLLGYRLRHSQRWTTWGLVGVGVALLLGLVLLSAAILFLFLIYHPMDPPTS